MLSLVALHSDATGVASAHGSGFTPSGEAKCGTVALCGFGTPDTEQMIPTAQSMTGLSMEEQLSSTEFKGIKP